MVVVALIAGAVFAGERRWNSTSPSSTPTTAHQTTTVPTIPFQPANNADFRSAWITYWDDGTGLADFRDHATYFSEINPFWYEAHSEGDVALQGKSTFRDSVVNIARAHNVAIVPTITENFKAADFLTLMQDANRRQAMVTTTCNIPVDNNYAGVDIDYESFALHVSTDSVSAAREAFTLFMTELSDCLHTHGKRISVTVLPKTDESEYATYLTSLAPGVFDYKALGAIVDTLKPMAYDHTTPLTAAGSTDPLAWVNAVADYTRKYVPAYKVTLALALYGYDWNVGGGKSITARQATTLARTKNVTANPDAGSGSHLFSYAANDSTSHDVWFDTSADTKRRVDVAKDMGLNGVAFWALGSQDRDFFQVAP